MTANLVVRLIDGFMKTVLGTQDLTNANVSSFNFELVRGGASNGKIGLYIDLPAGVDYTEIEKYLSAYGKELIVKDSSLRGGWGTYINAYKN